MWAVAVAVVTVVREGRHCAGCNGRSLDCNATCNGAKVDDDERLHCVIEQPYTPTSLAGVVGEEDAVDKGVSRDGVEVHELEVISPVAQSGAEIHHVEARARPEARKRMVGVDLLLSARDSSLKDNSNGRC